MRASAYVKTLWAMLRRVSRTCTINRNELGPLHVLSTSLLYTTPTSLLPSPIAQSNLYTGSANYCVPTFDWVDPCSTVHHDSGCSDLDREQCSLDLKSCTCGSPAAEQSITPCESETLVRWRNDQPQLRSWSSARG